MAMLGRIIVESLILWVCYAAYMAVLVHSRGPVGGIFFYPQAMIDRVMDLGLITEAEFQSRKRFAFILLFAWMLVIPGHTGWTDDLDFAFRHRTEICKPFTKKHTDPEAPYDGYIEDDDTEEKARAIPLAKKKQRIG